MQEQSPLRPLSDSQMEALENATASYQGTLLDDQGAVRYLIRRGIEEPAALTFRLGVVGKAHAGHEKYAGWLALPYIIGDGTVVSMRFRCLQEHDHRALYHGKYMSLDGEKPRVYNAGAITHAADDVIDVTEGELDAVMLTQLGLHAVAIPGASGFSGHHRRMLAGFNPVRVWGDPDPAGGQFVRSVTTALDSAVGVPLIHGDVTDTYLNYGPEAIYSLIQTDEEDTDE